MHNNDNSSAASPMCRKLGSSNQMPRVCSHKTKLARSIGDESRILLGRISMEGLRHVVGFFAANVVSCRNSTKAGSVRCPLRVEMPAVRVEAETVACPA